MAKENLKAQVQSVDMPISEQANKKYDVQSGLEKLAKFGGFDLLESTIENVQNMNPERKARRQIFLSDTNKKNERNALKKTLELWLNVLKNNASLTDMVAQSEDKSKLADKTLQKNLASTIRETEELEKAYRTIALFYKNTDQDKVKNVSIINAELEQLTDLDNTRFIDAIHSELVDNYDRLDLKNNYGLLVIPGYLGSNKVVEKWAKIAHENKVMLVTDFAHLDEPDDVMEMFDEAYLTGGEIYRSNVLMTCNWLVGRGKFNEIQEENDLYIPPSAALAGKIYGTLMSQVTAGKKFGGINYVTEVLVDFVNRRAFENFTAKTRKEIMNQIVRFLDGITGPDKLIENFEVRRFEQDAVQKDRIYLDIHLKPYFPAKNFLIKMDGHKGDDGNEWDTEYEQK